MAKSPTLAAPLKSQDISNIPENIDATMEFGTFFYRSPDWDQSNIKKAYDQKVDMFSLGITFFEMWYPFKSKAERFKVLQ